MLLCQNAAILFWRSNRINHPRRHTHLARMPQSRKLHKQPYSVHVRFFSGKRIMSVADFAAHQVEKTMQVLFGRRTVDRNGISMQTVTSQQYNNDFLVVIIYRHNSYSVVMKIKHIRPQKMLNAASYRTVCALACIVLSATSCGTLAQTSPVRWLSVDMPHGGCSLTAQQDGSATIRFGAMPRWVQVAPQTFKFEQLVESLRAKSYAQRARNATGPQVGSLILPVSNDLLFLHDHELVRSLLEQAWRARVPPTFPHESEDYAWVSKACSLP